MTFSGHCSLPVFPARASVTHVNGRRSALLSLTSVDRGPLSSAQRPGVCHRALPSATWICFPNSRHLTLRDLRHCTRSRSPSCLSPTLRQQRLPKREVTECHPLFKTVSPPLIQGVSRGLPPPARLSVVGIPPPSLIAFTATSLFPLLSRVPRCQDKPPQLCTCCCRSSLEASFPSRVDPSPRQDSATPSDAPLPAALPRLPAAITVCGSPPAATRAGAVRGARFTDRALDKRAKQQQD